MRINLLRFHFAPVPLLAGLVATLALTYVALIAVVMSYAAITVQFSQSVKDDAGQVATLEASYLAGVASITNVDYTTLGYAAPAVTEFVPAASATALR